MKPEHPQEIPDDAVTPVPQELILALERLRPMAVEITPEVDAAVMRAASHRLKSCRPPSMPRVRAWLLWPLATAACFLLVLLSIRPAAPEATLATAPPARHDDPAAIILREVSALFPNQVRSIVKDESGIQMTLADNPDVKPTQALVLKICEARGCHEIITFSGQNIEVAGHQVTVHTENGGRVILDGEQFLWSSDLKTSPAPGIHIESRWL